MSTTPPEDTGTVRFTVKELFARIDAKLDTLASVLDAKADHAALEALALRVDVLEKDRDERAGASRAQWAIVGVLVAILGMLVPIVMHVI